MTNTYSLPEDMVYICVEGVIGAGKTALCRMMEKELNGRALLEHAHGNPFLSEFYRNRQSNAFQNQIWFLTTRYRQLYETFSRSIKQGTIFVSDYLFAKDAIFASVTLSTHEYNLYKSILDIFEQNVRKPDFVIYLQASTDVLMQRIESGNRTPEITIHRSYIDRLNQEYNHFFFNYNDSPLLIVNTDELDFIKNRSDFDELIRYIQTTRWGSTYYNPLSRKEKIRLGEKREERECG